MKALLYAQRVIPAIGAVSNRIRFPGLWTGLRVEISGPGELTYGRGIRVGEGTRIDLAPKGRLVLGDGIGIGRGAYFFVGSSQHQAIGRATNIQDGCRIYGNVAIGRGCIFSPNILVSTGKHTFDAFPHLPIAEQERVAQSREPAIRVMDDCWIGINAVLMPGITVGRGCIIGANAVVTKNLAPYSVAVGAPARTIRQRLEFAPPMRIEARRERDLPYFYDGFELVSGPRDELVCEGDFSLALSHPGAHIVRLCMSGDDIGIRHGDVCQTAPRAPGVIEFALQPDGNSTPFLNFTAEGPARIHWAELVG